jgi:anti-sigma B factor antagonist
MEFKVRIDPVEGVDAVWVAAEGKLDIATAQELREASEVAARIRRPLVLDLSECAFLDSSGLRSVLHAHEVVRAVHRTMVVVSANPQVRNLLAMVGIDVHIRVFPTRADVLAWLKREEAAAPLALGPSSIMPTNGRRPPALEHARMARHRLERHRVPKPSTAEQSPRGRIIGH